MAASMGMIIGYLVGSAVIGALFGLIPFFLGRKRGQEGLGTAGLICCIVGNLIFTGAGIIIAVVFSIIILVKG